MDQSDEVGMNFPQREFSEAELFQIHHNKVSFRISARDNMFKLSPNISVSRCPKLSHHRKDRKRFFRPER
jgi:hypothetical protein